MFSFRNRAKTNVIIPKHSKEFKIKITTAGNSLNLTRVYNVCIKRCDYDEIRSAPHIIIRNKTYTFPGEEKHENNSQLSATKIKIKKNVRISRI